MQTNNLCADPRDAFAQASLTSITSPGAAGISFGLPILCYVFTFVCNDISGCPAPSLLNPKTLSIEQLKLEVGWPTDGIYGLASWKASAAMAAYYLFNLILYRVLPAIETEGTVLASGGRLNYRFNSMLFQLFLGSVVVNANLEQLCTRTLSR